MSENLKTIKELADELGVSKQNLQYHVKFLPTKKRQKNESGIVVLNIEEQMFISGRIKKNKAKDINDETKKGQKCKKQNLPLLCSKCTYYIKYKLRYLISYLYIR